MFLSHLSGDEVMPLSIRSFHRFLSHLSGDEAQANETNFRY